MKAFQMAQRQPQQGETIDDIIKNQMKTLLKDHHTVEFTVIPQMTNQFGSLSYGAMTTIIDGNRQSGNQNEKARGKCS